MRILFATANPHKLGEIRAIFPGHEILTPSGLGLPFEHEETGASFLENALGKALTLQRLAAAAGLAHAVLADDSGLVVAGLGGEPGIFSARYGSDVFGRPLSAAERNDWLLERMAGLADRRGSFVCAMVLLWSAQRFWCVQESLDGQVARAPAGSGGFGYDPLFYLPGPAKTVAELDPAEKNVLSHRGKAGSLIMKMLAANTFAPGRP
jgi:XTP/dITP diphosphohydrolase